MAGFQGTDDELAATFRALPQEMGGGVTSLPVAMRSGQTTQDDDADDDDADDTDTTPPIGTPEMDFGSGAVAGLPVNYFAGLPQFNFDDYRNAGLATTPQFGSFQEALNRLFRFS